MGIPEVFQMEPKDWRAKLRSYLFSREAFVIISVALMLGGNNYWQYRQRQMKARAANQQMQPYRVPVWDKPGPREDAHLKAAEEWIAAAKLVATQSDHAEAKRIVQFLDGSVATSEPHVDGIRPLDPSRLPPQKIQTWLIPYLAGDEAIGGAWLGSSMMMLSVPATYRYDMNYIVVRELPMTTVWKGALLLFHTSQAQTYNTERFNFLDSKTLTRKAVISHTLLNEVLSAYAGPGYTELVDKEIDHLKRVNDRRHLPPWQGFAGPGNSTKGLDELFGVAQSDEERILRQTVLWRSAVFTWINREFVGDKDELKIKFLSTPPDEMPADPEEDPTKPKDGMSL